MAALAVDEQRINNRNRISMVVFFIHKFYHTNKKPPID